MFGFLRPKRVGKGLVKTVADVPSWLGWNELKSNSAGLADFVKPVFKSAKPMRKESFEQALARLKLTEDDLKTRYFSLRWQSWMYVGLAIAMLVYAMYLLAGVHVGAFLIASLLTILLVVKFATCRFWMFQIRKRRLGCRWRDWLHGVVNEEPSS